MENVAYYFYLRFFIMAYETKNKVGSPRLQLLNMLKEAGIYSEFPQEGFVKLLDEQGYYFSEELVLKEFKFSECEHGKTSGEFMERTGYSRPKINQYIEKHGRVCYIHPGYYDLEALGKFLTENIKEHIEKRGRPPKSGTEDSGTEAEEAENPEGSE